MTFPELQIQLDLNPDNRIDVLRNVDTCQWTSYGYLFVDNENGQCYLFDKNGNLDDIRKVKRIENKVFYNCKSLTKIKIPSSVKSIGKWTFAYCMSLTSIEIPDSVERIGHGVFFNCKFLTSVTILNSIKNIGNWAFEDCTSLINIKIPNSVENIGDCAFEGCTSLINIKIPNSVENIGNWAFEGCASLKELIFKGKTIDQVKAMEYYPWEIEDTSIIKTES